MRVFFLNIKNVKLNGNIHQVDFQSDCSATVLDMISLFGLEYLSGTTLYGILEP